ncbi:MAG: sigma-70 family RNA polymerase sigma factor [Chloroflexi bacterium]|nr:sigma-70 family RNA polymerase sigma factor [Chloroflexota bacterium]
MNTTQICKKCNKEKQLSEYHRRGPGYQRICKECRKAHVPSGEKRIIFLNPPELYEPLAKRIETLESKLRSKARSFSNDPLEADDIYGAMIDEILFKCKPEDSDSRILTRATWAAKACVRKYRAYSMMVEDEASMLAQTDEQDKELVASPSRSAEDEFFEREKVTNIMQLISTLPKEYQVIVSLLSLGHNQREIAHRLQKSDQTVSSAIKNIAKQLTSLGLSQSFA